MQGRRKCNRLGFSNLQQDELISCAGTSVTGNVKAHGETVYFYKHAEAMKTLHKGGKSAKCSLIDTI